MILTNQAGGTRTRRKRTAMAGVTAGAAALVVLAGAGTAQAEEANNQSRSTGDVKILADHEMYTSDQVWPYDPAGHMWFNEYGDVVTLCDNDADGQKVTLAVTTEGKSYGMSVGGEGNCVTRKASMGKKYNLPENKTVTFEIYASGDPDGSYNHASWLNDN
ncbi:MAG: hypothetical protein ACTH2Q_14150 [Propionibacteriaceae bacterium]